MYYVVLWKSSRGLLYFECKECKNKKVDVYYKELSLPEDSTQVLESFYNIYQNERDLVFTHFMWKLKSIEAFTASSHVHTELRIYSHAIMSTGIPTYVFVTLCMN